MNNTATTRQTLYWKAWDSPFGMITVCCSDQGVRQLQFDSVSMTGAKARAGANGSGSRLIPASGKQPGARLARQAVAELRQWASGRRQQFTVPLDLEGTAFQKRVWKALLGIPCGETRSYQQIARAVGNPRASRAVGMANHWNPVAILVPCHRVIASDGSLGGYGGGLDRKSQMLRLEAGAR